MKDRLFDQPVFVRENTYLTREIASLFDAIDYLEEWPEERRDVMHETVLRAGRDAIEGSKPVSAFEQAFATFARKKGVAEDPEKVLPWLAGVSRGGGGQLSA